jgi:predicted N-formylglutamate amidohydrolase
VAEALLPVFWCPHAGNCIPAEVAPLFAGRQAQLATHEGYDLGALELSQQFGAGFSTNVISSVISRLVVDLNDLPQGRGVFSAVTKGLPAAQRAALVAAHARPYHDRLHQRLADLTAAGRRLVCLAIHTFTPVLRGETRTAEIGLLYHPARPAEAALAHAWQAALTVAAPQWRVRRNYPYRGVGGYPAELRRRYPAERVLVLELEVNQALAAVPASRREVAGVLVRTLKPLLAAPPA